MAAHNPHNPFSRRNHAARRLRQLENVPVAPAIVSPPRGELEERAICLPFIGCLGSPPSHPPPSPAPPPPRPHTTQRDDPPASPPPRATRTVTRQAPAPAPAPPATVTQVQTQTLTTGRGDGGTPSRAAGGAAVIVSSSVATTAISTSATDAGIAASASTPDAAAATSSDVPIATSAATKDSGPNAGALAGGIVGALTLFTIMALVFIVMKRRKAKKEAEERSQLYRISAMTQHRPMNDFVQFKGSSPAPSDRGASNRDGRSPYLGTIEENPGPASVRRGPSQRQNQRVEAFGAGSEQSRRELHRAAPETLLGRQHSVGPPSNIAGIGAGGGAHARNGSVKRGKSLSRKASTQTRSTRLAYRDDDDGSHYSHDEEEPSAEQFPQPPKVQQNPSWQARPQYVSGGEGLPASGSQYARRS